MNMNAVKRSSRTSLSDLTEEVDCPWLDDDVRLLFGRSKPADRLVTRFTGDEEFGRFDAIVADGDRLNEVERERERRTSYERQRRAQENVR